MITKLMRVVVLGALALPACSKSAKGGAAGTCTSNSGCTAGAICIAKTCHSLCNSDSDCAGATTPQYCNRGACFSGHRSGAPSITAVNGDGSSLAINGDTSGGQPAPNRLRQQLVITGTGLSGCAVTLANSGTSHPLSVASGTDTQIVAVLPQDVENDTDHHYVLSVVNGAGSAQTTVWLLQGEPGPSGPAPDATQIQSVLAGMSSLGCNGCVSSTDLAPGAVTSTGNYIPNGDFAQGSPPAAWTFDSTTAEQVSTGTGTFAMQNLPDGGSYMRAVITSDVWVPVQQSATYHLWGSFMMVAQVANVGQYILAVRLRDNTGAEIPGPNGEPYWWYALVGPAPSSNPTTGTWVNGSTVFGFGTAQPLPAGVKDASVAIILNDNETNPGHEGTRQFQVQGVGFFDLGSSWIRDGGNDVFYTGGNVGIGTSTPAALLDVNGNVDVSAGLSAGTVTAGTLTATSSLCTGSNCVSNLKQVLLYQHPAGCGGGVDTTQSCKTLFCNITTGTNGHHYYYSCDGTCAALGGNTAPVTCPGNPVGVGYLTGP